MLFLTVFYVCATFIDWAILAIGQISLTSKHLECEGNNLVVNDNTGSLYMSFFTLSCYIYAMIMWVIFYKVPKKTGMVRRNYIVRGDKIKMIKTDESLLIKEDNVKTVIAALDEDNQQYRAMRKTSMNIHTHGSSEVNHRSRRPSSDIDNF